MFQRLKNTFSSNWLSRRYKPIAQVLSNVKNFATDRFGKIFSEDDIERECRRNPYLEVLTSFAYDRAFADGMEIIDTELDKEKQVVEDLTKELKKQRILKQLTPLAKIDSKYGVATAVLFNVDNRFGETSTEIKGFIPKYVRFDYHEGEAMGDRIKSIQVEECLRYQTNRVTEIKDGEDDYNNVFLIRTRPSTDYPDEGIPEIESVWDICKFANIILEACMVAGIRVAFGIRTATIMDRGDKPKTDAAVAAMETGMKKMESGDTSIVFQAWVDKNTNTLVKDEMEIHTGSIDFDYAGAVDMAHKVLSMQTSFPKNFWDGIFQGSLTGAKVVDEQLESAMKQRRLWYTDIFTDIIRRWCELNGFDWKDSYEISWLQEEILTEQEQAEIDSMKASTESTLTAAFIKSEAEARESLGLKGPPPEKPDPNDLGTITVKDKNKDDEDTDNPSESTESEEDE